MRITICDCFTIVHLDAIFLIPLYTKISGYSQSSTNSGGDVHEEFIGPVIENEAIVWEIVGSSGGRLVVPEYGVSLTITEGSISQDSTHKLYLGVLFRTDISTVLSEQQVS